MIHLISKRIASFLLLKNVISENDFDVYVYGYEMIISGLIDLMIILITGIFFNKFKFMTTFFVMFVSTRLYTGGYHADTFIRCKLVFITICIIMAALSEVKIDISFVIISLVFFIITVFYLSPVDNKNKVISEEEKGKYRVISIILSLNWSIIAIITYFCFIQICRSIAFTAVRAVVFDNILTVVSASADVKATDGSMFTFYVNVDTSSRDYEVSILGVTEDLNDFINVNTNNRTVYYYGDANGDGIVDGMDASCVLFAIANDVNYPNHRLPITYVQNNISSLFPNIPYAKITDTFTQTTYGPYGEPILNNNVVSEEDAYDILTYYAIISATEGSGVYSGICGSVFYP